jgi:crotonobetainyl-CoA:carnitine CoA-transferase CaiB-like acyl-CoA transferase
MVRSEEEWQLHPHAKAVAELPLLEIVKIGESDPEPLGAAQRPLENVRVLDLTHVIAGPVCGRTLAEHGADVMRVSAPHRYNHQDFVVDTGHGKLSVNLDLRNDVERQNLLELLAGADIFAQGFRPNGLAKFGLTVDDLVALRPGLIYVTLSAFGHEGPWATRRGFDSLLQTTTGIAYEGGEAGVPKHLPAQALDYVTGYLAAFGAMVALERRARVGGSYLVRVSLAQTGHWIQSLGRVDAKVAEAVEMPGPKEVAPWMVDRETGFGTVRHVKPVLQMSETEPHWSRPTMPFGAHEPVWP